MKASFDLSILFSILLSAVLIWQCDAVNSNTRTNLTEQSCEGCHTNLAALTNLATTAGSADASGHLTPLSAAQRVHIQLTGGEADFADIDSIHARVTCSGCHGGQNPVSEENDQQAMAVAHQGMETDPSEEPDTGCGGTLCHSDIVRKHLTSIHRQVWGEKTDLATRFGGAGFRFENLPVDVQDGFQVMSLNQKATCGQCHISRPDYMNGGFAGSETGGNHKFIRVPRETYNCTACHSNTVGAEWRGDVMGTAPNVHSAFGFDCSTCHTENLHGGGSRDQEITSVYEVKGIASCYTPCHSNDADDNLYHQTHWGDQGSAKPISCFVCHGQNIKHFEAGYAADDELVYEDFKVGLNPNYQLSGKPHADEKWQVVRHFPISRDSYAEWGLAALPHFDDVPTYRRASPHNIQRWTARTLVDSTWASGSAYTADNCYENCHLHGVSAEGSITGPLQMFYLMSDYLDEHGQADEKPANEGVTVDENGQLFPGGCNVCHGA